MFLFFTDIRPFYAQFIQKHTVFMINMKDKFILFVIIMLLIFQDFRCYFDLNFYTAKFSNQFNFSLSPWNCTLYGPYRIL
jgi:hypothetical protein